MRGRKARLKNFNERAKSFALGTARNPAQARKLLRDGRSLLIGLTPHKRLALKMKPSHLKALHIIQRAVFADLKMHPARTFKLVKLMVDMKTGVQEFHNKPSLNILENYFLLKAGEKPSITREEYLLAKQFANQNKTITPRLLGRFKKEFNEITKRNLSQKIPIAPSNVIILGHNRDGTIRAALVDI